MKAILDYVSTVMDTRQEKKLLHKMMNIIMLVFFASLGNADDWAEMEVFGRAYEKFLQNYLELPNGIPSHNTIQRVFAMVQKANHIVSAVDEKGFCLGQKRVEEKTNEINAIPELLDSLNIKGTIITTDAMGT